MEPVENGRRPSMSNTLPTHPGNQQGPLAPVQGASVVAPEARIDPAAMAPEPSGGPSLRRYIGAVLRFKWLVLLVAVLGTSAGVGVSRILPRSYSTEAKVWVAVSDRDASRRGPIQASELLDASGWVELLYSYRVLGYVVSDNRLYLRPRTADARTALRDFVIDTDGQITPGDYRMTVDGTGRRYVLATASGTVLEEGPLGAPIGQAAGFRWSPPPEEFRPGQVVEFTVRMPNDVVREITGNLSVRPDQNGNFITLGLAGTDPVQITNVLNATVERFIEVAASLKRAGMDERTAILEEQRRAAQANLMAADLALQDFRVRTITLPTERTSPLPGGIEMTFDPVFTNFYQLRLDQERLKRDREAIRRVVAAARDSAPAISALELIEPVRNSSELMQALQQVTSKRTELRALTTTYTEEHPRVARVLDEISTLTTHTIPTLASALERELEAQNAALAQLISSASTEMQAIPPRMIEETRLQRDQETAATLFAELSQRYEEARIAAAASVPDVRLLDRAMVPNQPSNDQSARIILMATMAALGMGILGAILLDRFDPRIRYPEHVTDELGLPILGAVPFVPPRAGRRKKDSAHQALESFRSIRMGLLYAHGTAGSVAFTVSSPEVGDGKSFVTCNLALAFADMEQRVLLIDADVRRGVQHRNFSTDRKPGLTDVLARRVSLDDALRRTRYPTLDVLTSGTRMQHGPELLASEAMRELMRTARGRYDVVIVDSPPLGAGVDPFILATITGCLALVVRTGNTNRELAGSKLEMVDRLPIRVLGAIMNGIPRDHREYRYYSYIPGYEVQDEVDQGRALPALHGVNVGA